jgi:RNA polymerase sigma-70 factor (ECF subfamily)
MPGKTTGTDTELQGLIDLANAGDSASREALLDHACDRLLKLTRKIFHSSGDLRRWEETGDVFQNSMLRLHRALSATHVESVRHFFNLAALQIRRELIDLARHHFGPEGIAYNHHTDHQTKPAAASIEKPKSLKTWRTGLSSIKEWKACPKMRGKSSTFFSMKLSPKKTQLSFWA